MSRRRKRMRELEIAHLIEHPPERRPASDVTRVLRLLDLIASAKPNKEAGDR